MSTVIRLKREQRAALWDHLLDGSLVERAAFAFCHEKLVSGTRTLEALELELVREGAGAKGSEYHLEVDEDLIGALIKRAHDRSASLVEFHSHPFEGGAAFSPYDLRGLGALVPHVLWRLPRRPYAAVVVAPDGFDSLVWTERGAAPSLVELVEDDRNVLRPSGATLRFLQRSAS